MALSRQAVDVLQQMLPISERLELGFPCPFYSTKPLSENTFNSAMHGPHGLQVPATVHAFRALFSTVVKEAGWRCDLIERQLAPKSATRRWPPTTAAPVWQSTPSLCNGGPTIWMPSEAGRRYHAPAGQRLARTRHKRQTTSRPPRRLFCSCKPRSVTLLQRILLGRLFLQKTVVTRKKCRKSPEMLK